MTEKQPPEWGDDPLSRFFSDAEYNDRAAAINYAPIYVLLQHVHATFRRIEEAIEKDNRHDLLVSRFLMVRTHSAFLGAIRLAMSGQASESFPVLRAAIEQAWYALHIAKDPKPPERAKIWLSRNDDAPSKAKCKSEFTVANVRSTQEGLDAATARELQDRYENLIDFGAHPSPMGVLTSMSKSETDKQIDYKIGILICDKTTVVFALRMAVAVAVGALKAFKLIYPERFSLAGIDLEIDELVAGLNAVFKPFVPAAPPSPGTTG
jgi:hypothetical protein